MCFQDKSRVWKVFNNRLFFPEPFSLVESLRDIVARAHGERKMVGLLYVFMSKNRTRTQLKR